MSLRGRIGRAGADLLPASVVVRRGRRSAPRVALTFDDGPDHLTHQYLDLLDRLEVRATFFLLGAACAARPADVRAIVSRGHEVAAHGFTHRPFPSLSNDALVDELRRCEQLLPPSEHSRPLVRPPRGATTTGSLLRCAAAGYRTVLWSLDSDDCRTDSVDAIVARVVASEPGEIVLFHEGQAWTLAALPRIVEGLRARGLAPTTVGELI